MHKDLLAQRSGKPVWMPTFQALARGGDPVLVLDAAGAVMRLSRPLGGVKPSDMIGGPLASFVAPSDVAAVAAAVEHALHPGIPQTVTAPVVGGSSRRWYRFHLVPWREASIVIVQCTDVDAEHAELERLRSDQHMMRDTQGLTHMGTWWWDVSKPHAEWTPGLYEIYGLDPATHVPTYQDYLTRVHPDDVDRVRSATEAVFNDHEPYSHDERIRHTDGTWRHLHTWARPVLDANGSLVALQGVCLDITERKEAEIALARSEARQKAILEHAGLGIATLSIGGRIEDANPAFMALLGAGEAPCMLEDALGPEAASVLRSSLASVFDHADGAASCTLKVAPDRWIRMVLSLAQERDEAFVVAVAQDVTAEHMAQEAEHRIHELEEAGRQRARRLGMASHEIKNPLTPMLLQMELLRRSTSALGERERVLVDRLGAQVQRLDRLVRDFLDAARAEEKALSVHPVAVDVAMLARGVVESHKPTAAQMGVDLRLEAPAGLAATADPGRVVQVIDNLLANALRFTPSGGHVTVRVEPSPEHIRIEVHDDGVGMSPAAQAKLFTPYAETGVEPVRPGTTTGLGLYVCKAIVEAHGGSIGVTSQEDEGTRVWFTLPA